MKWRNKKFTFMVIPDANSTVKRFRLSAAVIAIAVFLIVSLLASCIAVFLLYRGNVDQIGRLQQELTDVSGNYEKTIESKNEHISDLQTDLADLSEQAREINMKMQDITDLESQLKEMVGIESTEDGKKNTDGAGLYAQDGGTGGEELPVTEKEMQALVEWTRNSFLALGERIETMKPELELTKDAVAEQQKLLAITPTIWPTDSRRITSTFGVRKDPFTRRATNHAGLDIGGKIGDPIYVTADGTVVEAGRHPSHGNNVMVSHSNGIKTRYSHLNNISTEVGAKVRKGDIIGELGNTGRSTGPHLHYEVIVNGEHVDPQPYLKASRRNQ
ncbi:peptidoglycan DD-metalloendopeptidase family protein [Paenibacillaceae bacterium WGS1546]|uniref:peptidoglycan DD-metalloendopeptidase family protein n=1 Tax=Cohnella sp. WGS1546 TaxID=3366810 RepID=UPI00372CF300